jgi:hypothetical protein
VFIFSVLIASSMFDFVYILVFKFETNDSLFYTGLGLIVFVF